jgi:3-oxoacyl-[acyl-carrier-protein] synthase-3
MKGDDVFNFVLSQVPSLINNLLQRNKLSIGSIDYFMFHQPNRFMLNKLADELGVPYEKMPSNIVENFGNASGVSIPTAIVKNLGGDLKNSEYMMCLAGFGVGLTWGALLMKLGGLKFCEMIEV